MKKTLDVKIDRIKQNSSCNDFILADAKDADMAYGIASPGKSPENQSASGKFRTLAEYRELIRDVIKQEKVDIVLMSASTNELLTIEEKLFDNCPITPAARANDTSDIHVITGADYISQGSRPFRTATIDHIQCGKYKCDSDNPVPGANLGLYSVTYNNDLEADLRILEAFKEFRLDAERKGFRYFLEVFNPNLPDVVSPEDLGRFINDRIVRDLAGVTKAGRPLFLKIVYQGPEFMEQLAGYDPDLIPGIMGGSSGTTYDAFKMLAEAKKYGARAALYGRKINNSENQIAFISFLRLIADDEISPEEAVKAYHAVLDKLSIKSFRSFEEDMMLTQTSTSYGGQTSKKAFPVRGRSAVTGSQKHTNTPGFKDMKPEDKLAYFRQRLQNK